MPFLALRQPALQVGPGFRNDHRVNCRAHWPHFLRLNIVADFQTLAPFILLLAAVLGLWMHRWAWIGALIAAVGAGYVTGALQGAAGVWLALIAVFAHLYHRASQGRESGRTTALRIVLGLAVFLLALACALVLLPGFPRTPLTEPVVLTPGAAPYAIGLGFAKVAPAILIFGIIHSDRVRSWRELGVVLRRVAPIWLATVIAVMVFTLAVGYVRFEPKWTMLFVVWAITNLFFTCFSEEVFFRGFLQRGLSRIGSNRKVAAGVAVAVSAVLFGLAHFGGGTLYVIAGTIAGVGYALAYQFTERVEAAMAVHFALNATHFLLFTYPAVA